MYDVLCKNIFLANLLGSQHLLEILQTSLTFKNTEKVVKIGCFEKLLRWRASIFFEMKQGYKISCIKTLMFDQIIRRVVFISNITHLIYWEN